MESEGNGGGLPAAAGPVLAQLREQIGESSQVGVLDGAFIIATGQSGHPLSPFYAGQLPLYREGKSVRLNLSEDELNASHSGVLIFRPTGLIGKPEGEKV